MKKKLLFLDHYNKKVTNYWLLEAGNNFHGLFIEYLDDFSEEINYESYIKIEENISGTGFKYTFKSCGHLNGEDFIGQNYDEIMSAIIDEIEYLINENKNILIPIIVTKKKNCYDKAKLLMNEIAYRFTEHGFFTVYSGDKTNRSVLQRYVFTYNGIYSACATNGNDLYKISKVKQISVKDIW